VRIRRVWVSRGCVFSAFWRSFSGQSTVMQSNFSGKRCVSTSPSLPVLQATLRTIPTLRSGLRNMLCHGRGPAELDFLWSRAVPLQFKPSVSFLHWRQLNRTIIAQMFCFIKARRSGRELNTRALLVMPAKSVLEPCRASQRQHRSKSRRLRDGHAYVGISSINGINIVAMAISPRTEMNMT
jgi:hypothetical protein